MGARNAVKTTEAFDESLDLEQEGDVSAPEALESGTFEVAEEAVTLVVESWSGGVQPGRLSWVFPSLTAALEAASALRNAATWKIVRGAI
jgi:hypothetical protein